MLMVIAVHSLMALDRSWEGAAPWDAVCKPLFFTANFLFFAMSGVLNLRPVDDEGIGRFYLRKVRGIVLPALVYMLIDTLWGLRGEPTSVLHAGRVYVTNVLGTFAQGHYWFVYSLFGFLLVTPFVARTFCNLRERPHELRAFAVLGLLFAGFSYLSANTGVAIGWALPWGVAFFVYCLGPSVLPREALAGRTRAFALVGALVSWMACVGLGMAGWTAQLYDNCPVFVVLAISLFVIVLDVAREWTPRAAVSFVAKHSFGVYLCHMLVMNSLASLMPALDGGLSIARCALLWGATFVVSLALAALVDTLVVGPLTKLYDRVLPTHKQA